METLHVLQSLTRAFGQLSHKATRQIILLSLLLAGATLILAIVAGHALILRLAFFHIAWIDRAIDALGWIASAILGWFLFPVIVPLTSALLVDRVTVVTDRLYYPERGPARRQDWHELIALNARMIGIGLLSNIVALPLYLFLPGFNAAIFLGLNGYFLGRQYFLQVAWRRFEPFQATVLRRRHQVRVWLAGIVIALIATIPGLNLLTPIIGTALMVHLLEYLR